eukprot:Lithocolla_globosa_v1_NODE_5006_length_1320_cov_23.265613.p1 type:complete len:187 gc:universal NODE_5006_length_1320_cov_23.265613:294-854(+)
MREFEQDSKPETYFDNEYHSQKTMQTLKEMGGRACSTVAKNCIPEAIKPFCHHKDVSSSSKDIKKELRSLGPIVFTRKNEVFLSMVNTGETNFHSVNFHRIVEVFDTTRSRGRGEQKRTQVIPSNSLHRDYNDNYWLVDFIDHMTKIIALKLLNSKHWIHGHLTVFSMVILTIYLIHRDLMKYFKV